jgi:serpin B
MLARIGFLALPDDLIAGQPCPLVAFTSCSNRASSPANEYSQATRKMQLKWEVYMHKNSLFIILLFIPICLFINPAFSQTSNNTANPVDATGAVSANNQFAFDLYAKYKSKEGNIFFSPYSISIALAMAYEGARGKTQEEIQAVFHFPIDDNARRNAFAEIYYEINKKDEVYALSTANALWAEKDYQFLPEYFNLIDKYYGGKVTNLNFVREPEASRLTINNWVEEHTNNRIKDLISPGAISGLTRLILTNAVYFKGKWFKQFDPKLTKEEDFKVTPEKSVKVQMMHLAKIEELGYFENDQLQILELPYQGWDLSMLILLPKIGDLKTLEESLTTEKLSEWRKSLYGQEVKVYIPKFKFESKYFMADDLVGMGMSTAFDVMYADFSGMTGEKDLFISQVIHQAFVEVNEEGTEAAAATAVVMMRGIRMPEEPKTFKADHPFMFIIEQKKTGNILFLGRVNEPLA